MSSVATWGGYSWHFSSRILPAAPALTWRITQPVCRRFKKKVKVELVLWVSRISVGFTFLNKLIVELVRTIACLHSFLGEKLANLKKNMNLIYYNSILFSLSKRFYKNFGYMLYNALIKLQQRTCIHTTQLCIASEKPPARN